MDHILKILSITYLNHNVIQLRVQKLAGYTYIPGQATELSINKVGWKEKKNPFTFTSLIDDPYLEFIIKIYPESEEGVTNRLSELIPGDELIVRDCWGAISYHGPGYFIAGGSGITPFIAILRQLKKQGALAGNKLFFSNRTDRDIILADELKNMLGRDVLFLIDGEKSPNYDSRKIDEGFLKAEISDFTMQFYVCGPVRMMEQINETLTTLGAKADNVTFER